MPSHRVVIESRDDSIDPDVMLRTLLDVLGDRDLRAKGFVAPP